MYGKVVYDKLMDAFLCEYPVRSSMGGLVICGRWSKDLVRHITRQHKIPARMYKKLLGIDFSEPLMSEDTRNKLRDINVKHKTYKNLERGVKYRFKRGVSDVQDYERSEQTRSRLRILRSKKKER